MPLYMPFCFSIVEWHCNHISKKKKRLFVVGAFSFSFSLGSPFSFSSTFSSFVGSIFPSILALLGYVIVEV